MNRSTALCLLTAGLLIAPAFAVSAQSATVSTEVAVDARTAEIADGDKAQAEDRLCPRDTGSRIATRAKEDRKRCNTFGRVYTSEDLQRTGASNVGDALRTLDPSIR